MNKLYFIEIRNQAHEMWAEGSSDERPNEEEIQIKLSDRGYHASNIEISYDNLQKFWRFSADIKKIKEKIK